MTSQREDWKPGIEAIEEKGRRAFLARDVETMRELFSEDLVVNSPLNRVNEGSQVLDLLGRGVIGHHTTVQHIEIMRRVGDLVIVMGREEITDTPGGVEYERRFTNVWRAEGDSWKLIARQATIVRP